MRRALNILSVASNVLLAISVLLFLVGYVVSPWDRHLSFSDDCHVAVWGRWPADSRIVFFNDSEYGPYRGSILFLSDGDGNIKPSLKHELYFGDAWGIYFRYFEWLNGTVLWTLAVSLWYPIAAFAILPAIRLGIRNCRGRNKRTS